MSVGSARKAHYNGPAFFIMSCSYQPERVPFWPIGSWQVRPHKPNFAHLAWLDRIHHIPNATSIDEYM